MNGRGLLSCVVCALSCFVSTFAHAQSKAPGFALDRFDPSERGSDWFTTESLDLRGNLRVAGGLVLDYARDPLVYYLPNGDKGTAIVSDQFYAHAGLGLILVDRVRLSLNMPVALANAGDSRTIGGQLVSSDNTVAAGDLRASLDVRLVGEYRDPATLAIGARVYFPTGSQDAYTGDGSVRVSPRAMLAGEISHFVYAAQLGFTYRANDDTFLGTPRGNELFMSASAGFSGLDGRLVLGPEIFGSSVTKSDAFFERRSTPFELLFGAHCLATQALRIGLGIGPGLTRGVGTPEFRGLLSVEWQEPIEPPAPRDRDGDGVVDAEDACPDVPGVRTSDPKTNGCPAVHDQDHDGVLDEVDACPELPGPRSDDPKISGCPDRDHDTITDNVDACPDLAGVKSEDPKLNGCPDRDGDGVFDTTDACPNEPGVKTDDPKTNGCPPPKDSDGDSILDPDDACPNAAGPPNPDPKKNGCPVARVEQGQIRIREQVQFAFRSAQILKASDFILEAVLKILQDNPKIETVSVEGHTDNKGGEAFNKRLSMKRAQAVVTWLVRHGVDKTRLKAEGFGMERPIDTNDTDEGRANNRRVEFHILEPGPTPGSNAP